MTAEQVKILEQVAERFKANVLAMSKLVGEIGFRRSAEDERDAIEAALTLWTRLNDENLASQIIGDCANEPHPGWCPEYGILTDGITKYRKMLLERVTK